MKAYTDISQSKKLAEFLPLESADMKEEWRDIEGYEGLYMVSNFGRVVSFQGCNPRIMKLGMTHKGYQCVGLQKEKQHKTCVVHRLVAKAFIPNPDNLPQVNHKDECRKDNDYTKSQTIIVKCPKCRVQRTDAILNSRGHTIEWLENVAIKNWNQRT